MKQKVRVYGIIALSLFKSNYKRQKRLIGAMVSVLLALWVGVLFLHNISFLLQLDVGEEERFYIEAQEDIYFINQAETENDLIYPYYQNDGYFFETHLFDYKINLSFHQFFNYNGPLFSSFSSNQIQLGGNRLLFQEISQVVEKEFHSPEELNDYLNIMPLPLHLYLHESHEILWIVGFLWLEEEMIVIPPYRNWSQTLLQQAGCQVVLDQRLARAPFIKKNYSIQKDNSFKAQLKADQLLLCQEQHCIIQQASAFLFHPRQVEALQQGYVYTPLSPYVSGVVYQQQAFVCQNMLFNQQTLDVVFQLDSNLNNEYDIAISFDLASYLGLRLKDFLTIQGRGNQKTYRVVEIKDETGFIMYKDSSWTVSDCLYLSAADPQEFLANHVFLLDSTLSAQQSLLGKPIQSSQALVKQEIRQVLFYMRLGILAFVGLSALLSFGFLILLLLFDTKELQQQFQLLSIYGYQPRRVVFILILTRLLSYAIALFFTTGVGVIFAQVGRFFGTTSPVFNLLLKIIPITDMVWIAIGMGIALIFVTFFIFKSQKRPKKV